MKGKIWVIENDSAGREFFLNSFGSTLRIEFSSDNQQELKKHCQTYPDAIIYDMEQQNTENLSKIIDCNALGCHTPVIVIVSDNCLELETTVRQQNVSYYFVKPIDVEELREAVESCVHLSQKNRFNRNFSNNPKG